jgi:hypothetical protein
MKPYNHEGPAFSNGQRTGPDAPAPGPEGTSGPFGKTAPVARGLRPTSQAERAVMHPDYSDPDWRYYHMAGVG